jgi:hypothetical protein
MGYATAMGAMLISDTMYSHDSLLLVLIELSYDVCIKQ